MSAALPSVLLVEDSEPIRTAFTILLEETGYVVHAAEDGLEALDAAAEHGPDLVLLDMGLPGMDGLEVVRTLKRQPLTADIPVIALTGRDDAGSRRACMEAGCVEYIIKPINTHALLRTIAQHLRRAPA
ncbi:MAG TPA: response regulator [Longimicrobium sp.]